MTNTIWSLVDRLKLDENTSMERYGVIYKITNLVNGKVYVGQTCRSLNERFWEHKKKRKARNYLEHAIKKHGKHNFSAEEIDGADSPKELTDRECFWIKFYRSSNRLYGYNTTQGGEGYRPSNQERIDRARHFVRCIDTGQVFISVCDAANFIGASPGSIIKCVKGIYLSCRGMRWEKVDKETIDHKTVVACAKDEVQSTTRKKAIFLSAEYYKDAQEARMCKTRKAVKCVQTDEVFSSIRSAAKAISAGESYLASRIRRGKSYKGRSYVLMVT